MKRSLIPSLFSSLLLLFLFTGCALLRPAGEPVPISDHEVDVSHGYQMMLDYFSYELDKIGSDWLDEVGSYEEFIERAPEWRRQYAEMLGLWPMPERTDMDPVITGSIVRDGIEVIRLHFQSLPGLYVTANLYMPAEREGSLPAVLYLPGHTMVVEDGVSYGPKVAGHYQTHPTWYAKNGVIALIIDTLHGGEVQGVHHGTYHYERWWWFNRGYTPGGVQTWNAIRALDYLESLEEVDSSRIVVTGLSGGGADSWSVNALDERPMAVVPVAGVTDQHAYLVEEAIDRHCDCMFVLNRFRRDTPWMTALGAPRPLLFSNNDNDPLFPLDGVMRVYEQLAALYDRIGHGEHLDLVVREGAHADAPQRPDMYRYIHERLTGEVLSEEAYRPVEPLFTREELMVFGDELPGDERNSSIDEEFVEPAAIPEPPTDEGGWTDLRQRWIDLLDERVFSGWPAAEQDPELRLSGEYRLDGIRIRSVDFRSQGPVRLRLWLLDNGEDSGTETLQVHLLDGTEWEYWIAGLSSSFEAGEVAEIIGSGAFATAWPAPQLEELDKWADAVRDGSTAVALVAPRGVGPTNWFSPEAPRDPIRRSFANIGQTRDGMRVWDVKQSIRAVRELAENDEAELELHASGVMAGIALYASLFGQVDHLELDTLPSTHRYGPILLNIDHVWEMPQALTAAAERSRIVLSGADREGFDWTFRVLDNLGIADRITLR